MLLYNWNYFERSKSEASVLGFGGSLRMNTLYISIRREDIFLHNLSHNPKSLIITRSSKNWVTWESLFLLSVSYHLWKHLLHVKSLTCERFYQYLLNVWFDLTATNSYAVASEMPNRYSYSANLLELTDQIWIKHKNEQICINAESLMVYQKEA